MKANEIEVGGCYKAKISNRIVTVRVDEIRNIQRFAGRSMWSSKPTRAATVYDVTNLTTGRKTTFRSAAKFRNKVVIENTSAE